MLAANRAVKHAGRISVRHSQIISAFMAASSAAEGRSSVPRSRHNRRPAQVSSVSSADSCVDDKAAMSVESPSAEEIINGNCASKRSTRVLALSSLLSHGVGSKKESNERQRGNKSRGRAPTGSRARISVVDSSITAESAMMELQSAISSSVGRFWCNRSQMTCSNEYIRIRSSTACPQ